MSENDNNLARKRIAEIVDADSFVEIGSLVSARNTDFTEINESAPSDGVVTGYAQISGRLVFVYAQNPTVLKGTLGEMHCKKIEQVYQKAMMMGAPVVGLIDSAGFRLQESVDALEGFGHILSAMTKASGVIPMYCVVKGNCGGGLSMIPSLSDFTFMEFGKGKLYVNSPNTIPNNYAEKLDTSDANYQTIYDGLVDLCGTKEEINNKIRLLLEVLPLSSTEGTYTDVCTDELNRLCEGVANNRRDVDFLVQEISDNRIFVETKAAYAPEMLTGFTRLNGITVGVIATRGMDEKGEDLNLRLTANGLSKATDFIIFCDAYEVPLLTITNTEGFETSEISERVLAKEMGRFVNALGNSNVPKINLVPAVAYGSAYVIMNSKSMGADLVYAWKESKIGMMDAKEAAKIIDPEAKDLTMVASNYETLQNSVEAAAKHNMVDDVIDPEATRIYLVSAFDMLLTKNDVYDKKHSCK